MPKEEMPTECDLCGSNSGCLSKIYTRLQERPVYDSYFYCAECFKFYYLEGH